MISIRYSILIILLNLLSLVLSPLLAQSSLMPLFKTIHGKKAQYTIEVPQYFKSEPPKQRNTDIIVADKFGVSISVNVSKRLPEEYQITAHDYSRAMFENEMVKYFPNFQVHNT